MTSHDVVAIARRSLGTKKIGHCGTLDPMATGLLMLVVERATKIQDLLMSEDKEYVGTLTLGVTTHTQDAQGQPVEEKEVPDFSREALEGAFAAFTGEFEQMPPMVSAIKKDGVPLYKLARKGQEVKRDPRPVRASRWARSTCRGWTFASNVPRGSTSAPTRTTSGRSSAAGPTSAPCGACVRDVSPWTGPSPSRPSRRPRGRSSTSRSSVLPRFP
jgi:tRNA U55 pseudouridine synthase TruB